jgi:hypothetical protein
MQNPELEGYIKAARGQGMADNAIRANLVSAGWAENDVQRAMSAAAPIVVPAPPTAHPGMWVTFQYILLFITLYVSAVSLGGLLYSFADKLIPDPANPSYLGGYFLQGYLAAIIVAFPIFATLFIVLKRNVIAHPAVKSIRARQGLFYLTLVVTFIIMMSWVISIVYGLLSGDVTGQVLAHFAVTLLIAGPIFLYLLREVRSDRVVS